MVARNERRRRMKWGREGGVSGERRVWWQESKREGATTRLGQGDVTLI